MFGRQERLAILLLLGVTVVVIASHLVLDHVGKGSFAVPYSDAAENGDLVIVSGSIDSLSFTKTGGHLLIRTGNLSIFVPGQIAANLTLSKGTNITIIGTVQTYQGKKEVAVQSVSDIIINR